ncbi:Phosphoheptose isomerase [Planctomycetes bacterium Poly30]|uniref:Phosphoheptose isomerase n=2 Tax=Saltatorellus ferox TaxID=2528018 RepID=A0A518F0V3_9BACT|nr:Phosphoheptose isomerase [Planctomycetes bacterium Poly30]
MTSSTDLSAHMPADVPSGSLAAIRASFQTARATLDAFLGDESNLEAVGQFAALCEGALTSGGKLMACGNGGSMCDAMHFAEEWTGRFRGNRSALPAIAFSDPSQLTCIANDFGYDQVFARSVEAYGRPGDVLVCMSTSGGSPNAILAVQKAKEMGIKTVALLGKGGGQMKDLADLSIVVPHATTSDRIQEIHIKVLHIAIEAVERSLFPDNYAS